MRRSELAAASLWRATCPDGWRVEPVDLSAVAAYVGVEILTWRPAEEGLNGALIRSAKTIFVNAALVRPRMRFAAAHELGHYVLGHEGDFFCPFHQHAALEREVNRFAAALLMPKAVVKTLWLKLSELTPAAKISALANRLEVSRQALGYRLRAVGIAGGPAAGRQRI
ncbi:MAG TPA: ImmA/IrrE family metallo-endopeptidase [bacterium]|nr:ImmA/IrrE family metallo-endopeptidase [bacterium]